MMRDKDYAVDPDTEGEKDETSSVLPEEDPAFLITPDPSEQEREEWDELYSLSEALNLIKPTKTVEEEDDVLTDDFARLIVSPTGEYDQNFWDDLLEEIPEEMNGQAGANVVGDAADVPAVRLSKRNARNRKQRFRRCLIAVLTGALILSAAIAGTVFGIDPLIGRYRNGKAAALFEPQRGDAVTTDGMFPVGMLAAFEKLYRANPEVAGWLHFSSEGSDILAVDYPVMFADNEKYLRRDFFGKKNHSGALFFDSAVHVTDPTVPDRVLLIYGNNSVDGQMFSEMDRLVSSVNEVRTATELTLTTLFERRQYRVFAVLITDENATAETYFNYRQTGFADEKSFLAFVEELRMRSLYDYPVDVTAEDELLLLATTADKSTFGAGDGRIVVAARRVREQEPTISTDAISRHDDVLMPFSWYSSQKKLIPRYYTDRISAAQVKPSRTTRVRTTATTADNADTSSETTLPTETTETTETVPTAVTRVTPPGSTASVAPSGTTAPTTKPTAPPTTKPTEPPTTKPTGSEEAEPTQAEPPQESPAAE